VKIRSLLTAGVFVYALAVGSTGLRAQTAPDNTKVNKRDRSKASPTADNAKDNQTDRDIMQKIRKSIMDDKSLSTYAHNVKIISQNGSVTLKGPVRSAAEKQTIEQKAAEVAGAGKVTNQMSVKPAPKTKKTT